jgi:hypothetical protein
LEEFVEVALRTRQFDEFDESGNVGPFAEFAHAPERDGTLVWVAHAFEGLVVVTHAKQRSQLIVQCRVR